MTEHLPTAEPVLCCLRAASRGAHTARPRGGGHGRRLRPRRDGDRGSDVSVGGWPAPRPVPVRPHRVRVRASAADQAITGVPR